MKRAVKANFIDNLFQSPVYEVYYVGIYSQSLLTH
jgi:hypothetical protein